MPETTLLKPHTPHQHTVFEDGDDVCTNLIGTTLFGETINRGDCSCDNLYTYDPSCKETADGFLFDTICSGQFAKPCFIENTVPDNAVVLAEIWGNAFILELMQKGKSFQFVAAPCTPDQQTYRVMSNGEIKALYGNASTPIKLIDTGLSLHPDIKTWHAYLAISGNKTEITWLDESNSPTQEKSISNRIVLTMPRMLEVKKIFDSLVRLGEETGGFALIDD